MNYGVSNALNVTFFNKETNEPIFTSDCTGTMTNTYEVKSTPIIPTFNFRKDISDEGITINIERIENNLLKELTTPKNQQVFKLEMNGKHEVKVQAKKHKQKRINKKWLKKYGYKTIPKPITIEISKCHIKDVDNLKEFSFDGNLL